MRGFSQREESLGGERTLRWTLCRDVPILHNAFVLGTCFLPYDDSGNNIGDHCDDVGNCNAYGGNTGSRVDDSELQKAAPGPGTLRVNK